MLRQRRAQQAVLNRLEFLEALELQHAFNKRSRSRPSDRVHMKTRERSVAKKARDADVGDGHGAEDEALDWDLALQILEHLGNVFVESFLYHRLVRLFTP